MSNKSIFARTIMVLLPMSFLLFSAFAVADVNADNPANPVSASAVNAQVACPTNQATDDAIVKAIQDKIKADPQFNDQRDHINVMSKNRRVKLEGWVKEKAQKNTITKFAQTTQCVIKNRIKNLLKTTPQGSCSQGQKPCCGGCIERASVCNCMN